MRDISMHVLDIVMNSIGANATLIEVMFTENDETIELMIKDNGCGMSQEMLENVLDPFFTTRQTRRVGLGIPLLYHNVLKTGGIFNITSSVNKGTVLEAIFKKNHIDCIPLGDINETIISLITVEPNIDYIYTYEKNNKITELNTKKIKRVLKEVPINEIGVINWLKEDLLRQNKAL